MYKKEESLEVLRTETLKILKENYSLGYMELDELEKRTEIAVNATNDAQLVALISDLKIQIVEKQDNETPFKTNENLYAVMGGFTKKGRWKAAMNSRMLVFMGGAELDFSEALLPEGDLEIDLFCVMGGIDIRVPDDIHIVSNVLPLMGGIEDKVNSESRDYRTTIYLKGTVFMGGITISSSK